MKDKLKTYLQGLIGVAALLILWTVATKTGIFGRVNNRAAEFLLPLPTTVLKEMIKVISNGYLLSNLWVSFLRVLTGFSIAVCIGLPLGIMIGMNETVRNIFYPIIRFVSPIPGVAWVPLSILWFGLGDKSAIFIIVMGSLSPIIVNTCQGIQNLDKRLGEVLDVMEASTYYRVRYYILPGIMPYVVAGFRLSLGFSWRVVIAAELVGVPKGMGYMLSVSRSTGNTADTLITIIALGIVMILMEEVLFQSIENHTNRWRKNQ